MTRYPYLLLDADNTLFHFDAANRNAFHEVCLRCDIPDTEENFILYESCNNAMWAAFDRGECTKDFLVVERFRRFLDQMQLDRDPVLCNRIHLTALGQSTLLLPYAEEVCQTLAKDHQLYLVTNAVASVQKSRLAKSALLPYITDAFISEEAGASKPSIAYFDYVFAHVDGLTKDNCIVIGDSLSSDIRGANNYELACCWYNPKHLAKPDDLRIDYEIDDLRELLHIV
ncbi:MAG: YjjG family noncanonical pyrimidine nucleotidase [Eubacteriales bacterium]|nr:YjjG family noncanonical pyrimidine nucleotidase [Eubacteriales bacterium]